MTIFLWHTIYIHTSYIHTYIHTYVRTYSVYSIFIKKHIHTFSSTVWLFGAAADVTLYLPLLRNVMAWLTAGGASYKTLKADISQASQAQTYTFFLYVCMYVCMYVCTNLQFISIQTHTYMHAFTTSYKGAYIHTYILEYIHLDTIV